MTAVKKMTEYNLIHITPIFKMLFFKIQFNLSSWSQTLFKLAKSNVCLSLCRLSDRRQSLNRGMCQDCSVRCLLYIQLFDLGFLESIFILVFPHLSEESRGVLKLVCLSWLGGWAGWKWAHGTAIWPPMVPQMCGNFHQKSIAE